MRPKLTDLTSAEAVQLALDEFSRKRQKSFLRDHGFGKAKDCLVRNARTGDWADSMAIVGVALGYQFEGSGGLRADHFSEGEAAVAPLLRTLGFEVKKLDDIIGSDWSRDEVSLIVADYLTMLISELAGQSFNKAARRQQLLRHLPGRTSTSVEFKHANISAAMLELGFPYLRGYKPRFNFQRSLLDEAASQIAKRPLIDEVVLSAVQRPATAVDFDDFSRVQADSPRREAVVKEPSQQYLLASVKRDYLEREALNRSLGAAGEEFAVKFEQWRLSQMGVGQLADRVVHSSRELGDGLGYDIRSFEPDGSDRFIEVKTTSFGERTPFFVSANEMRFAQDHAQQFHLYRLFDFRASPRLFTLEGPISRHCNLDPTTYRASFG